MNIEEIIKKRIDKHNKDIKLCQETIRENPSPAKAKQMVDLMSDSKSRIFELEELMRIIENQ